MMYTFVLAILKEEGTHVKVSGTQPPSPMQKKALKIKPHQQQAKHPILEFCLQALCYAGIAIRIITSFVNLRQSA